MGMGEEFREARDWIAKNLDFDKDYVVSVFETTIRSLGGLLSAYDWSKDIIFLEKAKDIGNRLIKALDETSTGGFPLGRINLKTGKTEYSRWLGKSMSLAGTGTLTLEFRDLSKHSGDDAYAKKSQHIFEVLKNLQPESGLFPKSLRKNLNTNTVKLSGKDVSFGAMGDSFYEYELKIWLQGMKTETMYRDMYDKSIQGLHDIKLTTSSNGLTYIFFYQRKNEMDHLTCFMGGLLALGAFTDPQGFRSERAQRDLKTAKALAYTCYQMYAAMETGLSPEVVSFPQGKNGIKELQPKSDRESYYILRPETIETFFILHRITDDPIYREWGWEIFQSIEKYCKTKYGYGSVQNVGDKNKSIVNDKMESFFLGETLKYLYLLYDPESKLDLNNYVFNTEAHPLRI